MKYTCLVKNCTNTSNLGGGVVLRYELNNENCVNWICTPCFDFLIFTNGYNYGKNSTLCRNGYDETN